MHSIVVIPSVSQLSFVNEPFLPVRWYPINVISNIWLPSNTNHSQDFNNEKHRAENTALLQINRINPKNIENCLGIVPLGIIAVSFNNLSGHACSGLASKTVYLPCEIIVIHFSVFYKLFSHCFAMFQFPMVTTEAASLYIQYNNDNDKKKEKK